MMNFKNKWLVLGILVVTLSLLMACGSQKLESKLIGEWELTESVTVFGIFTYPKNSKLEFYKDGNMSFMGIGSKYEIIEDKIKILDDDETTYNEYELNGNTLTLHMQASGMWAGKVISLEFNKVNK